MRNVKRLLKPNSLKINSGRWKRELLNEITRCKAANIKVDDKFYDKYKQKDVKERLDKMYDNCCCFCEAKIGIVDYPHIEHKQPKRQKNGIPPVAYPELTFEWVNLHLACKKCNTSKGTQYDTINPILDAAVDIPIEDHFTYQMGVENELLWWPKTQRGETTRMHADLNRSELAKARLLVFIQVYNNLIQIKENPLNPGNSLAIAELKKMSNGKSSFGSIYKFLLRNQGFL